MMHLDFQPSRLDGVAARVSFDNGYGASIVKHNGSYGFEAGKYELAVLDSDGDVDSSTPVTGDVLGWLSLDDVNDALLKIQALPQYGAATARDGLIVAVK